MRYISGLSTDAADSWKDGLIDCARIITQLEQIQNITTEDNRKLNWTTLTLQQFHKQSEYLLDKYSLKQTRTWQSLNLSEYFTYKSLGDNQAYLGRINNLLDRINKLEKRVSSEVRNATPYDRSTQPPLL